VAAEAAQRAAVGGSAQVPPGGDAMSARCTLGEDACDAVLDELRPLLASTLRAVADEWQLLPHAGWPSPCRTHASNLSGLTGGV
jgi:hypothetical protein